MKKVNLVIPMAGQSKRFTDAGYVIPKSLLMMGEKNMIETVVDNLSCKQTAVSLVINRNQIAESEIDINNVNIVGVDYMPDGPAMTALLSLDSIDKDLPLVISNCDQIIEDFRMDTFLNFCDHHDLDGCLGVFHSNSPKNSYVKINSLNEIVEVKEKEVISSIATNGLHYWRNAYIFEEAVKQMVEKNDSVNDEFYIAPSFNYMIADKLKIMPFWFNLHFPIGTPDDFETYLKNKKI